MLTRPTGDLENQHNLNRDEADMLVHTMPDQSTLPLVIDYAKHQRDNGAYDIVIFELQDATSSQLCLPDKHDDDKKTTLKDADAYRSILGDVPMIVGMQPISHNDIANELYRLVCDQVGINTFFYPTAMILYHSFDYALKGNPWSPVASKYKIDLFSKQFLSAKVMQRVWLNRSNATQQFLPEKIMIAAISEIGESKESLDILTNKIISLFGINMDIFIKADGGSLGSGNMFVHISDEQSLNNALINFQQKKGNTEHFTIESASLVGQSIEKDRVDTYRLVGVLTKESQHHQSFKAINLWHSASYTKDALDSHEHAQADYFVAGQRAAFSVSAGKSEDVNTRSNLSIEKTQKHLNLPIHKPNLFAKFEALSHGLSKIELADSINQIPVYNFDNKPFDTASTRVVFSSECSKEITIESAKKLFAKKKYFEDYYNHHFQDKDPLNKVQLDAKNLQPRNWNLITEAAVCILNQAMVDFKICRDNNNEDALKNIYVEVDNKLMQLVDTKAAVAEEAARMILDSKNSCLLNWSMFSQHMCSTLSSVQAIPKHPDESPSCNLF